MTKELDIQIKQAGNGYILSVMGEAKVEYSLFGSHKGDRAEKQMVFTDPFEMAAWLAEFLLSQMPAHQAEVIRKKMEEDHHNDSLAYLRSIYACSAADLEKYKGPFFISTK